MYLLVIFLCISNQKCTSDSCCCVCTIFIFSVYTVANSAFFNTTFLDKELSDIYTKGQFIHYLLTIEAFIWVCIQQNTTKQNYCISKLGIYGGCKDIPLKYESAYKL